MNRRSLFAVGVLIVVSLNFSLVFSAAQTEVTNHAVPYQSKHDSLAKSIASSGAVTSTVPVTLDITHIPRIMRSSTLNWPKAATLMEKWFAGPVSISPNYRPPDTTTIKMDWVLQFARAKSVYDAMIRDRIWVNPPAKREIEEFARRKGYLVQASNEFNTLNLSVQDIDKDYIQSRPVEYDVNVLPDESVGALGRFVFRIVIAGSVVPTSPPLVRGHLVTINEIGIYVRDSYDFEGTQLLGCWNEVLNSIKLTAEPGWECVSNATFRNYRTANNHGGDFLVFSDVKRVRLTTPDTFVIPETR